MTPMLDRSFNKIVPQTLLNKLETLILSPSLCNCVMDKQKTYCQNPRHHFLLYHPHHWLPSGMWSEPNAIHSADQWLFIHIFTSADDTAVVRLIAHCSRWNSWRPGANVGLTPSSSMYRKMIVDCGRRVIKNPLYIDGAAVKSIPSLKYFGVHLNNDLTWQTNYQLNKGNPAMSVLPEMVKSGHCSPHNLFICV